jgi:hypothetical protein
MGATITITEPMLDVNAGLKDLFHYVIQPVIYGLLVKHHGKQSRVITQLRCSVKRLKAIIGYQVKTPSLDGPVIIELEVEMLYQMSIKQIKSLLENELHGAMDHYGSDHAKATALGVCPSRMHRIRHRILSKKSKKK